MQHLFLYHIRNRSKWVPFRETAGRTKVQHNISPLNKHQLVSNFPCYADPCQHCMGASSDCEWKRRPSDTKGRWKYIAYAVEDSRQGLLLQLGVWAKG